MYHRMAPTMFRKSMLKAGKILLSFFQRRVDVFCLYNIRYQINFVNKTTNDKM